MRISKWMLSVVIATLMLSFGVGNPQVFAASLKDMKNEKSSLDQKKENLDGNIKKKEKEISTNNSKVEEIQGEINKLNKQVDEANGKIMKLQDEISETVAEVERLQASIADLERKIEERDEVLTERVRAMQVNGGTVNYLDVLLGANSFSDFIDRISAVTTLVDADRKIMKKQADDQKQLEEEKKLVEQKLAQLEKDKKELEALKADLQSKKAEQDRLVEELNKELKKLNNEKSNLETDLHEVHELSAKLTKEIEAEENRLAELARQAEIERKKREEAAANSGSSSSTSSGGTSSNVGSPPPTVSSGVWTRPTTGPVTSEFGRRNLSYAPASKNHRGTDIGAPTGTPVVAAGNGVVGRTGPMGGYGNVVMVTHSINGKIYTTLYAHLSSTAVSAGQQVSKGQTIGRVGTTGNSTGPHLHFELHIGGWTAQGPSAVNPRSHVPL